MARAQGVENPEVTEYFRYCMKRYQKKTGKNDSQAAAELETSAPHYNNIMKGIAGVGGRLMQRFAEKHAGGSMDQLLTISKNHISRIGYAPGESGLVSFSLRFGWADCLAKARKLAPQYSDETWEEVGRMAWPEGPMSPRALASLARAVAENWDAIETEGRKQEERPSHSGKHPVKVRRKPK